MTEREIAAAVGVSGFVLLGVIGFVLLLKVAIGPSKNGVIVREVSSRPAGTTDAETEKGGKTEPLAVPASSQHAAPTKSGDHPRSKTVNVPPARACWPMTPCLSVPIRA